MGGEPSRRWRSRTEPSACPQKRELFSGLPQSPAPQGGESSPEKSQLFHDCSSCFKTQFALGVGSYVSGRALAPLLRGSPLCRQSPNLFCMVFEHICLKESPSVSCLKENKMQNQLLPRSPLPAPGWSSAPEAPSFTLLSK